MLALRLLCQLKHVQSLLLVCFDCCHWLCLLPLIASVTSCEAVVHSVCILATTLTLTTLSNGKAAPRFPSLSFLYNLLTTGATLTLTTLSNGKPAPRFPSLNFLYNLLTTRTERSVNTWLHKPPSTYHRQLYNICTFRWQLWSHYLTAVIFVKFFIHRAGQQ